MNRADRPLTETNDDVSLPEACGLCRAVLFYRYNQHPGFEWQIIKPDHAAMQRYILPSDADVAAPNSSIANQPSGNELGGVAGDRKAHALRWSNHRGVHKIGRASCRERG